MITGVGPKPPSPGATGKVHVGARGLRSAPVARWSFWPAAFSAPPPLWQNEQLAHALFRRHAVEQGLPGRDVRDRRTSVLPARWGSRWASCCAQATAGTPPGRRVPKPSAGGSRYPRPGSGIWACAGRRRPPRSCATLRRLEPRRRSSPRPPAGRRSAGLVLWLRPRVCGTERSTPGISDPSTFLNPSTFSVISARPRNAGPFSSVARPGTRSKTNSGSLPGRDAMNGTVSVKFSDLGWHEAQVRPLPPNVAALEEQSAPLDLDQRPQPAQRTRQAWRDPGRDLRRQDAVGKRGRGGQAHRQCRAGRDGSEHGRLPRLGAPGLARLGARRCG